MSPKMKAYIREMVVFPEVHVVRVYAGPDLRRKGAAPLHVERFSNKNAANDAMRRLAEEYGAWAYRDCRRLFDSGDACCWSDLLGRVMEINPG